MSSKERVKTDYDYQKQIIQTSKNERVYAIIGILIIIGLCFIIVKLIENF